MAPELCSKNLHLRPLTLKQLSPTYVNWLNDPTVNKYLETGGNYTIEQLHEYLSEVEKKDMLFWAIHLVKNGKHIGNIKIDPINPRHGTGEYGIMMGDTEEWGKGYASEASTEVINYCFNTLKLRKMTLGVVQENQNAVKLYEKLGFNVEGLLKYQGFYGNRYLHVLRMALFNKLYTY